MKRLQGPRRGSIDAESFGEGAKSRAKKQLSSLWFVGFFCFTSLPDPPLLFLVFDVTISRSSSSRGAPLQGAQTSRTAPYLTSPAALLLRVARCNPLLCYPQDAPRPAELAPMQTASPHHDIPRAQHTHPAHPSTHPPQPFANPRMLDIQIQAWDIRPIPSDHFKGHSTAGHLDAIPPELLCLAYQAPVLTLVLVL